MTEWDLITVGEGAREWVVAPKCSPGHSFLRQQRPGVWERLCVT